MELEENLEKIQNEGDERINKLRGGVKKLKQFKIKDKNKLLPNLCLVNEDFKGQYEYLINKANVKLQNNRLNLIYTHNNNFISLGKIPSLNLQSSNNIETYNKSSNKNSNKNSNNIVDNQDKKIENEDKAEEEFLKREELKLKDSINEIENNTINKKDEEEGKENVTDDEEDIKNKKK